MLIACSSHDSDDTLKSGKSENKGTLITLVACDYLLSKNAADDRISQVEKCLEGLENHDYVFDYLIFLPVFHRLQN